MNKECFLEQVWPCNNSFLGLQTSAIDKDKQSEKDLCLFYSMSGKGYLMQDAEDWEQYFTKTNWTGKNDG